MPLGAPQNIRAQILDIDEGVEKWALDLCLRRAATPNIAKIADPVQNERDCTQSQIWHASRMASVCRYMRNTQLFHIDMRTCMHRDQRSHAHQPARNVFICRLA